MLIRRINIACFGFALLIATYSAPSYAGGLKDTTNHADYVVIAPASYFTLAEKLAAFHHQKDGFAAMVVDIDSIISQFGKSVSPDTALRNFIRYTLKSWSDPKPQYFVLAGNINAIPSHPDSENLYLSGGYDTLLMIDQWFVQPSGIDTGAGACIGRFPAWDSASLSVMINKTISYETDTSGTWYNRAISVADYRQQDGCIFERDAESFRPYLDSLWNDTISVHIRSDSPNYLDSYAFVNLWNQGAAIVSYLGHANEVQLSYSRYFTTWTVDSLTNGNRLPVCLLGGCDLTWDTGPDISIPTHLLAQGSGGAVAVVSSEGLMYEWTEAQFFTFMVQAMISEPGQPVGRSFAQAMYDEIHSGWYYPSLAERITLLGDPALVVKHSDIVRTFVASNPVLPLSYVLEQNYPNPFNPTTTIGYKLPGATHISLKVYDILGREVRTLVDARQAAGSYSAVFNASGLASGVYFYRLQAGSYTATRKLLLMK